jgi:hypothetical protein
MRHLLLACALLSACVVAGASAQGKPGTELAYVDGQTVTIAAMHFITSPSAAELANANYLYLAAYPWDGSTAPAFASGYVPNCDPCFHPGLPDAFVYHDHVLSGAPTRGNASAARHLIILLYSRSLLSDPTFEPLTSVAAIKAGEAAGMFQAIGTGANPYEVDSGILAVTPSVSPNA